VDRRDRAVGGIIEMYVGSPLIHQINPVYFAAHCIMGVGVHGTTSSHELNSPKLKHAQGRETITKVHTLKLSDDNKSGSHLHKSISLQQYF